MASSAILPVKPSSSAMNCLLWSRWCIVMFAFLRLMVKWLAVSVSPWKHMSLKVMAEALNVSHVKLFM